MTFTGFVDDSGSGRGIYSGDVYVLAGFVSTAERWKDFSDSFSAICDKEPKIEDFHMYEVYRPKSKYRWQDEKQRDERVAEVVNLIKEKALYRVDSVLAWPNYERIVKGRVPPEIDSPYFLLYYNTILAFAHFMDQANVVGTVDWVFDDQGALGQHALSWYSFIRDNIDNQVKKRFGSTPVFRHDKEFLPLKSADVYAWQVRRHLAKEQPVGIRHNDRLDSLLSIFGTSTIVEADHMQDFVWHSQLGMGLMLKSMACHFIPK
jgi:uncharacterized protein DUF3800